MTAETTCQWYVTELPSLDKTGQIEELEYVHCNDESGFCILKDLFTKCYGRCKEYIKVKNNNESKKTS